MSRVIDLPNGEATQALGHKLASVLPKGVVVYLEGDLGMGKTTLSQGILRGFGYSGPVKSPTYTLVESYQVAEGQLHHFDLYRLSDPEELEFIGIRDYFDEDSLSLVEWPCKGEGVLPDADLKVVLSVKGMGRCALLEAASEAGERLLNQLA